MNKKMWIAVLVLIIIIGAYVAITSKKSLVVPTDTPVATSPETPTTTAGGKKPTAPKPTTPVPGAPAVSQNVDVISQSDWRIAFTKPTGWEISTQTLSNKIVLSDTVGDGKGDSIIIEYVMGDKITDTDAKFGQITYYYEKSTKRWMETDNAQTTAANQLSIPAAAKIVAYTADKLPVYPGTKRWLTYIIPLSTNTFLKLNITGSGATAPLQELVKTIHKI